jgi:solute carrier family 35 protein C2
LLIVVAIIAAGEFLTVMGEVEFKLTGFLLCLCASVMSGARWTLVQLKLQTMDPPLKTTIVALKMLAPSMFVSMLAISLCFEQPWNKFGHLTGHEIMNIVGLGSLGAAFAISMILCEFYLIMRSSAVVLMIGGVLKEMFTIVLGVTFFDDELNRINVAGCIVVFIGILYYKVTFHLDKHKREGRTSDKPPSRFRGRLYRAVLGDDDDDDDVSERSVTQVSDEGGLDNGAESHGYHDEPRRLAERRIGRSAEPPTPPSSNHRGTPAESPTPPPKRRSVMELQNVELRRGHGTPSTSPRGSPQELLV